jgi:hypothetical protein
MWACAICGSLVLDIGRRRHEYVCVCTLGGGVRTESVHGVWVGVGGCAMSEAQPGHFGI